MQASKTQCNSRLSKPLLEILSIYRKNILGKQLSLAICSKYIFRLLHAPKCLILPTKLNMMVKVVKLFTGVLWKGCSNNFIGKDLYRSLFFNNVSRLQVKNSSTGVFLWVLSNISERIFCKTLFVRYIDLSEKKRFNQPWLF